MIFEKIIEIAKYYDWESIFRGSHKNNEPSKLAKYGGMPTRIATMPIGMIKDLATGGIVGMTKNIIPRAKNIFKGDSIVNHAQGKSILLKELENANNTEEHKG